MSQLAGFTVYNGGVYEYPNRAYRGYGTEPAKLAAANDEDNSITNPQKARYMNSDTSRYTTSAAGPATVLDAIDKKSIIYADCQYFVVATIIYATLALYLRDNLDS